LCTDAPAGGVHTRVSAPDPASSCGRPITPSRTVLAQVTADIYGHWESAERKLQAAKMEGAFPSAEAPY
jgi:hypothetical protein